VDAEHLLGKQGAVSAVDRAHTALHEHLREVCTREQIPASAEATMTESFRALREHHPAFRDLGPRAEDIGKVLRALALDHPRHAQPAQEQSQRGASERRCSVLRYVDDKLKRYTPDDALPF
jgi:hypothetical protein